MNETREIPMSDGARIHVELCGDGPPLLLLHGFTGVARDFAHVFDLDALAGGFRLILPDARGHGRSTDPEDGLTFRRAGLDVLELLDHLALPVVQAIGFSFGAKTLLHAATGKPASFSKMVLASVAPRFPESTLATFRALARRAPSAEEWALLRARHTGGDAQIKMLLGLPARFGDDPTDMYFTPERLSAITADVLVVAGEKDALYPVELAREVRDGIRGSGLWVIPGGSHMAIFEGARAEFERRARAFLAG